MKKLLILIILIIGLILISGCRPSAPLITERTSQFENCITKLSDIDVNRDQRQINTINCFKDLAQQNYDVNLCLQLEQYSQIGCLIGFAKAKNDLSICELGQAIVFNDCIENVIQKEKDCYQLKNKAHIEECLENAKFWLNI